MSSLAWLSFFLESKVPGVPSLPPQVEFGEYFFPPGLYENYLFNLLLHVLINKLIIN